MTTRRDLPDAAPAPRILLAEDIRGLSIFSVVLLVIVPTCAVIFGDFGDAGNAGWRPRLDVAAFMAAPLATRLHAITILTLVFSGAGMLALPKGDRRHRLLGRTWVGAMLVMAAASLAVPHGSSWVAAYVGGGSALGLMAYGVVMIRMRRARDHARTMAMLMIALTVMTLLAFIPGRLLHSVAFAG